MCNTYGVSLLRRSHSSEQCTSLFTLFTVCYFSRLFCTQREIRVNIWKYLLLQNASSYSFLAKILAAGFTASEVSTGCSRPLRRTNAETALSNCRRHSEPFWISQQIPTLCDEIPRNAVSALPLKIRLADLI